MDRTSNGSPQSNRKKGSEGFWVRGGYFDYQLLFLVIIVVLFGLMMVLSSSSFKATQMGLESYYFAKRQAVFGLVGIAVMYVFSRVNYKKFLDFAKVGMIVAILLCGAVFIIGSASHGATRWIPIGSMHFQPSEVAKPALILYTSAICVYKTEWLKTIEGLIKALVWQGVCIVLIAKENLSTAIICFAMVIVIVYVATPRPGFIWALIGVGVLGAIIFIFAAGYRQDRIDAWLHPETSDSGFQTMQSLYAIGSGGLFGRGLGESIQKMGFLPESHNDMIFAVICEELGIFGALCIIALFVMIVIRCRYIANHSYDRFGGLVVTGVMTHIAVQFAVNVGVVTNTIPPTGVTLPFVSYGGSSLVFLLLEIGMIEAVARQMRLEEEV